MQRQGGGKQRGGGNDPTCGCDMQAGWPPASTFPRGGLQGGAIKNAKFSFSLTNNEGKVHNYKGHVSRSNKMKTMKSNRTPMSSAGNEYKPVVYKGKRAYKSITTGNMFTRRKNGTLGSPIKTPASNRNSLKPTTMAPPPVEPETMEVSEPINNNNTMNNNTINNNMNNNNNNTNNNNTMGDPGSLEYDTESAENNNNNSNNLGSLPAAGGGRRRTHRRKHSKRCPCMLCYFKKLKLSRKNRH